MKALRSLRKNAGVALVVVLGLIVFLALILVAFVAQTRVEVQASSSFSQGVAADSLADDAVNSIVGLLQKEIEAGSTVTNAVYKPKTFLDTLPRPDGSVASTATITNVPNLLRTSRPGALFVNYGTNSMTIPTSLASGVGTDKPAVDGQKISLARWNAPQFLTTSQNSSLEIPKWIYVTRSGAKAITAWANNLGQPLNTDGGINNNYVIGRYAYRIYDTSGLIDVNVAGYPGSSAPSADRIGKKGGLSWASLPDAGLQGWNISDTSASYIPNWRGLGANFTAYVDGDGAKAGYLASPATVDGTAVADINRFLDRTDLLGFINSSASSQFTDKETIATQVTAFSREKSAPSWGPDTAPLDSPAAMNPFFPAIKVTSVFDRADGTKAKIGEPLVNKRFPLSKISLLDAPDANAGANAAAIRSYFGLQYNGDGTWSYVGGTNTSGTGFSDGSAGSRERLLTLEEVAAAGREPNFFELLQAGIMANTLGQAARDLTVSNPRNIGTSSFRHTWSDKNIARQVLQIGANIIDQFDLDNDPTVIRRPDTNKWNPVSPDPDIAGIENTPRIQLISPTMFRDMDVDPDPAKRDPDGNPNFPDIVGFFQFQLWNPHRNAPNAQPGEYRIVGQGNLKTNLAEGNMATAPIGLGNPARVVQINNDPGNPDQLVFNTNARDFREPHLLRGNDVTASNGNDVFVKSSVYAGSVNIAGFFTGRIEAPYEDIKEPTPATTKSHQYRYGSVDSSTTNNSTSLLPAESGECVFFQLQKKDSQGHWIPVQTIPYTIDDYANQPSVKLFNINSSGTGVVNGGDNIKYFQENTRATAMIRRVALFADPRTIRFGGRQPSVGSYYVNTAYASTDPNFTTMRFVGWLPSNPGQAGANKGQYYESDAMKLYDNRSSGAFSVADRGTANVTYRLTDTAVGSATSPANPSTLASSRPVMLGEGTGFQSGRAFKSVAEMGYAYRDVPWKSLNFVNDVENPNATNPVLPPADSALLDLFTISEIPDVRAGVINLNLASKAAIKALLLGTNLSDPTGADTMIDVTEAESAAEAIYRYLGSGARKKDSTSAILTSAADIARMIQALSASGQVFNTYSKAKKQALAAALAQAHNGRTWNLVIDVVAQSGKFSPTANSLERFSVSGQERLLVHLALDRYTGEVVDKSVERVVQ